MFFPRLRRQAKWVFVFLALAFALGFVAFGVGSSLPSGFADILQSGGTTDLTSVGEARDKVEDDPADADAQLELSRAYQRDANIDEAVGPLAKYAALRPKDENALQGLAGLYTIQASRAQEEGAAAGAAYQAAAGITVFQNTGTSNLFQTGTLDKLILDDAQQRAQDAQTKATSAYANATTTYGKLVKVAPKDAELWYLYALSAESASKPDVALKGYRQFLKLSPDAGEAPLVKERIKSLEQAGNPAVVSGGGVTRINR